MRYKSFEIKNFKGIQHTKIDFDSNKGPKIFTLVGLNESGKTTLLEAIHTDIVATRYRRFVGENPDKPTYFQPILDKLDFVPAKMDFPSSAILVEGKSDFYILSYFDYVKRKKTDNVYIPSSGANDLGPLIALYLGWGRQFVLMLDGDKAGIAAKKRYLEEFGLPENSVILCPEAANNPAIKDIEDILKPHDISIISHHFGITVKPSKRNVMRFFQEKLAAREDVNLSPELLSSLEAIADKLRKIIGH